MTSDKTRVYIVSLNKKRVYDIVDGEFVDVTPKGTNRSFCQTSDAMDMFFYDQEIRQRKEAQETYDLVMSLGAKKPAPDSRKERGL